jgi:hypothetical protein
MEDEIKNLTGHRFPWEMTWREYEDYVVEYIGKYKQYPEEMKEIMDVVTKPHEITGELGKQFAAPVHQILMIKALARAKAIPEHVLKEYSLLMAQFPRRFPEGPDTIRFGFDVTSFESAAHFRLVLNRFGLSEHCRECRYHDFLDALPLYLWEGKHLQMITANNPLAKNGYASFIGIEGEKEAVVNAAKLIRELTGSNPSKGLEYIGFENILCYHQKGEQTASTETQPPVVGEKPITEVVKEKEADTTESTKYDSGIPLLKHVEAALENGQINAAVTIINSMYRDIIEGFFPDLLPHLIRYRNHPKLKEKLADLEFIKILNSQPYCQKLTNELWSQIPDEVKEVRKIKPVVWKPDPADKGLRLLLQEFTGQDELRPELWGANFGKQGITATDSKKLIFINKPNATATGIYCITKFCFEHLGMGGADEAKVEREFPLLVNELIPKLKNVIRTVSINAIRRYCKAMLESGFVPSKTKVGLFTYAKDVALKSPAPEELIYLHLEELNACAEAFAKLGIDHVDIGFDEVEIVFNEGMFLMCPAGKIDAVAELKTHFTLQKIYSIVESRYPTCALLFNFWDGSVISTKSLNDKIQLQSEESATLQLLSNGKVGDDNPPSSMLTQEDLEKALQQQQQEKNQQSKKEHQWEQKQNPAPALPSHSSTDYLDKVVAVMHDRFAKGEHVTSKGVKQLAHELGVPNMGQMWEAVELSWMLWYRMLYKQPGSFDVRLKRMVGFWNKVQPTYQYSDSSKELFKQYSTPCPIAAIVAEYTGMSKGKTVFEPSAGNGLFVLGADPARTHVNEIDKTRAHSLEFQGFKRITSVNAAHPFPEDFGPYDVVVTNPPFAQWDEEQFEKDFIVSKYFDNHLGLNHHMRLEHVMAGLALSRLKNNGKAAIIIMGHQYYGEDGYFRKFRPFFNWLYRHYHVDDLININSFKLYNKQGAIERTMLILISGRKSKPEGVSPRIEEAPHLADMVNSFEELWHRVRQHIPREIDIIIQQLKIALAA